MGREVLTTVFHVSLYRLQLQESDREGEEGRKLRTLVEDQLDEFEEVCTIATA
jgi:hypothetical protein